MWWFVARRHAHTQHTHTHQHTNTQTHTKHTYTYTRTHTCKARLQTFQQCNIAQRALFIITRTQKDTAWSYTQCNHKIAHKHTQGYIHTNIHMHQHTYTHIHIHTHKHTFTYARTHTHAKHAHKPLTMQYSATRLLQD